MADLETIIISLINSKREGDYWDFKEEPHDNNASLLHDIICLANSLHEGERYLIIGVSDPKNGASIKGLKQAQLQRKDQTHFIDLLRTKNFAGDIRPEVELKTIIIDNKEVDVLIIFDRPYKPYYLVEDYRDRGKKVFAHHIYCRTNDSNTPMPGSADIGLIERMWRQRFGLHLSPMERMKRLLRTPGEWFKDIGNKKVAYHIQHPEYTIEFSEVESFWEPYTLFYTNEKALLGTASFKCHSTVLFELEYMYCDEMRITLPVPETEYVQLSDSEQWFYYYDLKELSGLFLCFLTDGKFDLRSRGSYAPFILFKNVEQHNEFLIELKRNEDQVFQVKPDFWSLKAKKKMTGDKQSIIDPLFLSQVYQFYNQLRIHSI
jgi:schlafen family protein